MRERVVTRSCVEEETIPLRDLDGVAKKGAQVMDMLKNIKRANNVELHIGPDIAAIDLSWANIQNSFDLTCMGYVRCAKLQTRDVLRSPVQAGTEKESFTRPQIQN